MSVTAPVEAKRKTSTVFRRPAKTVWPWLLVPPLAFYAVFFGYPLARLVWQSFWNDGFTLAGYLTLLEEPIYWRVLGYTFALGLVTLAITLVVGYVVAYWLVGLNRRWTVILMACVMIPFWSSGLVRTYAWLVILGRQGFVNTLLLDFGIISEPMPFIGTNAAVVAALAYYLLPYMILTLYSVMNAIEPSLMLAAQNLGASPWRAFVNVFMPLTKPGVIAGSYIVFMLGIGMYITPAMLGGPDQTTLPLVIAIQINEALDWNFAAVLSVTLLLVTVLMQIVGNRYVDFDRMWGGSK